MRVFVLGLILTGAVWSQAMTEAGAAAAGSTVGSVAGKGVSSGINNIFKKVNGQTAKAAGARSRPQTVTPAPARQDARRQTSPQQPAPQVPLSGRVAPPAAPASQPRQTAAATTPKYTDEEYVVPPPPAAEAGPVWDEQYEDEYNVPDPPLLPGEAAYGRAAVRPARQPAPAAPPPPPPPVMTAQDLAIISTGTAREEVLGLGQPSSRITMFQDGHLVEIFSYRDHDQRLGRVRLQDGLVAQIERE